MTAQLPSPSSANDRAPAPQVLIETHGCKLNMADSQRMARDLARAGYALAANGDAPDVYILDSCTVTHVADRKARQALARARRDFPDALIVATGCMAQRDPAGTNGLDAVDLVVTNAEKPSLAARVTHALGIAVTPCGDGSPPPGSDVLLGRSRASLKIQEGCDQVCAYCIVPRVRGRELSVPDETLVKQVGRLVGEGCREVVLTGTQLGSYGFELPGVGLASMLRRVLVETKVERLRVSSLQPGELTPDLLGVWTEEGDGRLCPHFHMPLQSGSDRVLSRMRRRYTAEEFLDATGRVRSQVPGASITGDVIAGFPGESEQDHAASLRVIEGAGFADLHVFPYSRRPGTSAAHFDDTVEPATRAARAAELRALGSELSDAARRAALGMVRPVLWETEVPATGLTDTYMRVRRSPAGARYGLVNRIEQVLLDEYDGETLVGVAGEGGAGRHRL